MEQLTNCDFTLDIELIETIMGGNQEFSICFTAANAEKFRLDFDHVLDLRYSIESGYIDRFCRFRENLPDNLIPNDIYIVKNSDYVKYFQHQASGTYDDVLITHYLITDQIDTGVDILTLQPPKLVKPD